MKIKRILAAVSALAVMSVSALNVSADVIETDNIFQFVSVEEDVFTPFEYELTSDAVQVYNINESNLDDDDAIYIEDDSVIVVFKKEYSELNKIWNAEDFGCSNISSIEDLTYLNFTEEEKAEYLSHVTFRQMLKINLIETGKDKVAEIMDIISQREDVKTVTPNVFFASDVSYVERAEISDESNIAPIPSIDTYSIARNVSEVIPNDPIIPSDYWVFDNTQLYEAWGTYTTGSSTVKVGVFDTGVREVEDLLPNLVSGYNGYYDNNITSTYQGDHGTLVASVIGAKGNNGIGVTGVNWDVSLVPIQIASETQALHFELAARCIAYANANRIPIINMSISASGEVGDIVNENIVFSDSLYNYNGLIVCSAGNTGINIDNTSSLPSTCDAKNIITVAAVDANDNLENWSNYGSKVDIAAPGTIITTDINGEYYEHSGTSIAAPFVSGVAALLLAYNPELTTMQLKEAILNSVDVKSSLNGKVATSGRINAYKALKYVEESDYRQLVCQVSSGSSSVNLFKDYITYDSDTVAYKGFKTWNSLLANNLDIVYENNVNSTNAGLLSVYYSGSSIAANQKLYTLKFEVNLTAHDDISNPLSSLDFYTQVSSGGPCYWAMLGDVNNDGNINNTDLTRIANYVSGSYSPSNTQKVAMDVNMDGTINLYDMVALQNYINGTITSF